jgi:hypothetical protein
VGDEVVLLNAETGRYFTLDPTGARVWALLARLASVEDACDVLAHEFQANAAELREDVDRLVGELIARGLIEVADDPHAG